MTHVKWNTIKLQLVLQRRGMNKQAPHSHMKWLCVRLFLTHGKVPVKIVDHEQQQHVKLFRPNDNIHQHHVTGQCSDCLPHFYLITSMAKPSSLNRFKKIGTR